MKLILLKMKNKIFIIGAVLPNYRFWNPFYAVANPKASHNSWYLKNFGTTSDMWKYMINEGYK